MFRKLGDFTDLELGIIEEAMQSYLDFVESAKNDTIQTQIYANAVKQVYDHLLLAIESAETEEEPF